MIDYDAPSSLRALEKFNDAEVMKRVFDAARMLVGERAAAEDLVSEAKNRVCDPTEGKPWDPTKGSFAAHMRIVMRDLKKEELRRARARREINASMLAFEADAEDPNPQPDEALAGARLEMRLFELGKSLRDRIAHNSLTLKVFERSCQGDEKPKELARALGCREQDIYNAYRQIRYQAIKILAEEAAAETAKMKEARAPAKTTKESP